MIIILAKIDPSPFIFFAGLCQMGLAIGSRVIPGKFLKWKAELSKVQPLIKQMFWTYAGYILVTNFCFGLISVLATGALIDGSILASAVTFFIALYWMSRIAIQFFYFDRKSFPQGKMLIVGEVFLVTLFVFLTLVYTWSFYINLER